MSDIRDLEKDDAPNNTEDTHQSSATDISTRDPEKEDHRMPGPHSTHSGSSGSSIHSDHSDHSYHSDPLSPLERALTPDLATEEEKTAYQSITRTRTGVSLATTSSRIPSFEVDFTENDPDDPKNWSTAYRGMSIGFCSFATWTVVLYSTSYTASIPGEMIEFNISSQPIATLGITTYLIGLAVGSLILAPLSELYGRRPVYIASLAFFCLLVLPCALATNLTVVLIVRFFGACAGAAMISNSPGTVADVATEKYRALAFSIWSIGPMNGPVTGPLIGGFTAQYLGWRWTNWLVMILSGLALIAMACVKETYAPVLLQKKAAKMRKDMDDERYWSRYDEKRGIIPLLKLNLSRPFIFTATEPILWFWDLYISIIYGILYLCFVAYPLIFQGLRGWSQGISGLAFVGLGIGTMLAISTEPLARKLINSHKKDPNTGRVYPEASVSMVCIGAFLCPIGQLWFSWTSLPITTHWIWPIMAGIPFGAGNCMVFIYASNYIAGCYGVYSASALAGNTVSRSLIGGTLPLAGTLMYNTLTPQWAGTLLGLTQVICIPIPFVFYKYGDRIRSKSPLIRQMKEDQERSEKRAIKAKKAAEKRRVGGVDYEEKGLGSREEIEKEHTAPLTHTITG
ncbi:major facilitator superfamily domain-containing protein [Calycina marina]|uniref:Major facilitator superfamily domain-containing protein n=1 Tax=Calycina marina TaxID=1763456 RepID=A0A9P8CDD3_9HELO|nr:major facilitator superfamily domain-containing protein [Calycina marina]